MENKTDVVILRGKIAVAAVDFQKTRIYALDQDSRDRPEIVKAEDPKNYGIKAGKPRDLQSRG